MLPLLIRFGGLAVEDTVALIDFDESDGADWKGRTVDESGTVFLEIFNVSLVDFGFASDGLGMIMV